MHRCVVLLLLLVSAVCYADSYQVRDEQRKVVYTKWMASFDEVVALSSDQQAKDVHRFVADHGMFAVLRGRSLGFLEPKKPNRLAILALMPQDQIENSVWGHATAPDVPATYIDKYRVVVLDSAQFSSLWRGFLLGHLAFISWDHAKRGYRWPEGYHDSGEGEVKASTFQSRLQRLVGGKSYAKWIDHKIELMRREMRRRGMRLGRAFPERGPYDRQLDQIFGPSLSAFDRRTRQSQCWRDACWTMLDREYQGNREAVKRAMIVSP